MLSRESMMNATAEHDGKSGFLLGLVADAIADSAREVEQFARASKTVARRS
jgi:hypothetical protein